MRKLLCLMLCLMVLPLGGLAEEPADFFDRAEADSIGKIKRTYDSPTLKYTVEQFAMEGERCYLTRVWIQEPARQIRKATADWKKNVMRPAFIAERIPGIALAVNGSGFVSPRYPEIPENYPGKSEDYHYTPLGSLTVTDGREFRPDRKQIVVGEVDLVFIEDGALVIVDYKTDRVKETEELRRHKPQLDLYEQAMTQVFGLPVKEKIIFSVTLNDYITV